MKLKGIWVAIAVICVAGIGATNYSVQHLSTDGKEYVQQIPEKQEEKTETTAISEEVIAQAILEPQEEENGILFQLAELDAQIQERRKLSVDKSANARKTVAELERKLWESKLQSILECLEGQLAGTEKDVFFTEQRNWVRERESTAVADSKKQSGSTLEELAYIRSLRDLTRERVYELAKRYEQILDEPQ